MRGGGGREELDVMPQRKNLEVFEKRRFESNVGIIRNFNLSALNWSGHVERAYLKKWVKAEGEGDHKEARDLFLGSW